MRQQEREFNTKTVFKYGKIVNNVAGILLSRNSNIFTLS